MGIDKILYNQTEVYHAIQKVFSSPNGRRIAISGFVGHGAESYLPSPKGITLVCWPKAGGTNPAAVRTLIDRKVHVWFADRLHMKVYWAEGRGCVITSANLSTNALGAGNLKEAGILVPSDAVDIEKLLTSLKKRRVNEGELHKLDRAHARYGSRNKVAVESTLPTFMEWYRTPMRPLWKLGWFDSTGIVSKAARQLAHEELGVGEPSNFLGCRAGDYRRKGGEWVLTFNLARDAPTHLSWMFVNRVVNIARSDKKAYQKEYPCQAVQLSPIWIYPGCPFRIDGDFRNAFRRAVAECGPERIKNAKSTKPPEELLRLIEANYEGGS
jgi:hypothetical protein